MILVTGGTGAMGSVLVHRLVASGERVRVLTLPNDPLVDRVSHPSVEIVYGDIAKRNDLVGICSGITTVYHCAAVIITFDNTVYDRINVGGTANILSEASNSNVGHCIYISSASVVYPHPTAYSQSKRTTERLVAESGIPYTIVRPTLVYGKRGGQEFDLFLQYLNMFPVVPFIGTGNAIKRPVYVEDIIEGLVRLKNNPVARGKTYNFSGAERITINDFARLCLRLMNKRHRPIAPLPVWFCTVLARIMERSMKRPPLRWPVIAGITQDADLDPSDAVREVGYTPSRVSQKLPECFPR
jgi:NADH dehydrogenase